MAYEAGKGAGGWRVGFVGAGVIADAHARALRAVPGARLTAVCDLARSKAESFQRRYGLPECYSSIAEMRQSARLDAVHILLPPAAHADATIECLESGWDVFVEKPMGVSSEECRRIAAAEERTGRRVGVNHNYTFNPAFQRLVRDVQDRYFGRIEHVIVCFNMPLRQLAAGQHGNWIFASPGNIVLELGPHTIGSITRLMGRARSATVAVSGETTLRTGLPFYDTWQMSFQCERGTAQCLLSVGREFLDTWIHVVGQDGSATVDLSRGTYRRSGKTMYLQPVDDLVDSLRAAKSHLVDGLRRFTGYATGFAGLRPTADLFGDTMAGSIGAFYGALRAGERPAMGAREGAAAIEACEMAIAAATRPVERYADVR